MNSKELTLKLHEHFNGSTHSVSNRFKENGRWIHNYRLEPYSEEGRLKDSTYRVFSADDGYLSITALTYQEIYEALKEILNE